MYNIIKFGGFFNFSIDIRAELWLNIPIEARITASIVFILKTVTEILSPSEAPESRRSV